MPGFREFAIEIRKRDTDYRDVTVNHIAFYGREVQDSNGVFRNKIVERDNTNQELADFQAQNVILSEDPSAGLIHLIPTDEDGNTEIKIGHWTNVGGHAQLDFLYGSGRDEEYNIRFVNNEDNKIILKSSGPELESFFNIETNVRVRKGNVSIEDTESFTMDGPPASGAAAYRQANGVNLEWNWGREDSILDSRGFTSPISAGWQMDLFSDKDVSNGQNQLRLTDKSTGQTVLSARQGSSIIVGNNADQVDDNLSRNYEFLVYDDLYVNDTATISGDTEVGGTLYVEEQTTISDSLRLFGAESVTTSAADGHNIQFSFGLDTADAISNGFANAAEADWQMDVYSNSTAENQLRITDNFTDTTFFTLRKGGTVIIGDDAEEITDDGRRFQLYGDSSFNGEMYMVDSNINFSAETVGISGFENDGIRWSSTSDSATLYFEEESSDVSTLWLDFTDNGSSTQEAFKVSFRDITDIDNRNPVFTLRSNGLTLENGTNINEFSTDTSMSDFSDDAVPTERAVTTFVQSSIRKSVTVVPTLQNILVPTSSDLLLLVYLQGGEATLPLNPLTGQRVHIKDAGNASVNNITIKGNTRFIEGSASDVVIDVDKTAYELVYAGSYAGASSGASGWWIV